METDNYPYILYKKERDHVSNILQVVYLPSISSARTRYNPFANVPTGNSSLELSARYAAITCPLIPTTSTWLSCKSA